LEFHTSEKRKNQRREKTKEEKNSTRYLKSFMFASQNFKQVKKEENPIANIWSFAPTGRRFTQVRKEKKQEKRKKLFKKTFETSCLQVETSYMLHT
jgi:hypothetical protein